MGRKNRKFEEKKPETLPITSLVDYPQSPEHEDQDTHQEKSKSPKITVSKETVEKIPPSSEEKEASKSGIFLRLGKKVSEALKAPDVESSSNTEDSEIHDERNSERSQNS